MRQCGVEHAVCHKSLQAIPGAAADEQPWSLPSLKRLQEDYEKCGLELSVYE
ncbi:MAG: mannonate dehydratase, partial [Planctomycetota bacterium]